MRTSRRVASRGECARGRAVSLKGTVHAKALCSLCLEYLSVSKE
jgi:hypothetical protein